MPRAAVHAGCGERRFVCGAAEELPFSDAVFDLVFSTISLRHWADLHAGLAEIHRVLTPGGRLIVATVIEMRRRRRRHGDAGMSATDLVAAGLVIDDIQRVAGFGPVPAVTIVTAHRAAATAPEAGRPPGARASASTLG
jgi:SAM-dependent methyltransferase